jgi:alanyl-tRNA synthetase
VIGVTQDLTAQMSAVDLVKEATTALGGKGGGGRPDLAQAGGTNTNVEDVITAIETYLKNNT